jgi:hypothetical protein
MPDGDFELNTRGASGAGSTLGWLIAPVWTLTVAAVFLFGPSYGSKSVECTFSPGGAQSCTESAGQTSGLAMNGATLVPTLLFPTIIALLPLFVSAPRARRIVGFVCCGLLTTFCVLAMMSIGWFLAPAPIALGVASFRTG